MKIKLLEKYMEWASNNKTKAIGYSLLAVVVIVILFNAFV